MDYDQTLSYLFSRLPMFQQIGAAAYTGSLDNTLMLDQRLGYPHKSLKAIHIAGTNGKGSVAHMLAAVLQEAGYRTGLYTSPHMTDFRERIRVDGACISTEAVVEFTVRNRDLMEEIQPSFFEITVAMAFEYFAALRVDVAVVETGMGGRLDSTNILTPMVSVITNIGLDHTRFLGDTPEMIATEKAGIIKPGVPVVIGQTQAAVQEVFIRIAGEKNAPLVFADQIFSADRVRIMPDNTLALDVLRHGTPQFTDLFCDLGGRYQQKNILTVLAVLGEVNNRGMATDVSFVRSGIKQAGKLTGLRGRWEVIGQHPLTVCDAAHNEDGLSVVISQVQQTPHRLLHVVYGTVSDKDPAGVLKQLPRSARYYFTQAGIPRALDKNILAQKAAMAGLKGQVYDTPASALEEARRQAAGEDMILITGSTFVVAEVL